MVHNGIEYGVMAAYAEGLAVLKAANVGKTPRVIDAEITPLRDPEHYQYDLDLADIAEVWRRSTSISAWRSRRRSGPAGDARGGLGRIVNVSSLTVLGAVERTAYAAAKPGLISFTRTWALELAATGITINAVARGPTETELFRANNPPGSAREKQYLAGVPMGRFGRPEEIAAAISFPLSDEAAFITGQTMFVDGGASIGKAAL
jgi:NAD(P)-dependent dehydrogenase (short-subunit alcohol dehydrogenase family)